MEEQQEKQAPPGACRTRSEEENTTEQFGRKWSHESCGTWRDTFLSGGPNWLSLMISPLDEHRTDVRLRCSMFVEKGRVTLYSREFPSLDEGMRAGADWVAEVERSAAPVEVLRLVANQLATARNAIREAENALKTHRATRDACTIAIAKLLSFGEAPPAEPSVKAA